MSDGMYSIFTIGHSTHNEERFLKLLSMHQVDVLADVRSSPFSKFNPQFNRENLERLLKSNNFRYVFLGKELGARSEDSSCYVNGRVQYDRLAQTSIFQSGVNRLTEGAKRYRIVLMCAEKEPLECHRTLLVARALVDRGISINHIHADGRLESQEDAMFRLLDHAKIPRRDFFRSHDELLAEALAKQEEAVAYVDKNVAAGTARRSS